MKGYNKTAYEFCVCMNNSGPVYRRVWEKDDRYFVKHNNEVYDVTDKRDRFNRF